MEYRNFGRTGLNVSEISFGAWAIGKSWRGEQDDDVSTVIPGIRTPEQAELNCAASDGKLLAPDELKQVKKTPVGKKFLQLMIDFHTHFFPENVFRAIWNFFETRDSRLWSVREKVHGEALVNALRGHGVKKFTSLVYAHKPGMAEYLNDFVKEQSEKYPELLPFGTVFAGDGGTEQTARKLFQDYGFLGIKMHPFVTQEALDDARFFPVYEIMESLGKILVCHPGSAPVFKKTDGHIQLEKILKQFPKLKVIIAHCGAFEFDAFSALADAYEHVYFDTAMVCVPNGPFEASPDGKNFFMHHQDKILFGSDFPNIPYAYEDQINGLRSMNLGDDAENKIFYGNARRLLLNL